MKLKFSKMHGLGNDFVVLDGVRQSTDLSPEQLRLLASRNFGVGCDQILLVEKPSQAGVDFGYRIFNADGGEVEPVSYTHLAGVVGEFRCGVGLA